MNYNLKIFCHFTQTFYVTRAIMNTQNGITNPYKSEMNTQIESIQIKMRHKIALHQK